MEPMELTADQRSGYSARPFEDLGEGYFSPEDLLPKPKALESRLESSFHDPGSSLCDASRSGGDFVLIRLLWSHFRATWAVMNLSSN